MNILFCVRADTGILFLDSAWGRGAQERPAKAPCAAYGPRRNEEKIKVVDRPLREVEKVGKVEDIEDYGKRRKSAGGHAQSQKENRY